MDIQFTTDGGRIIALNDTDSGHFIHYTAEICLHRHVLHCRAEICLHRHVHDVSRLLLYIFSTKHSCTIAVKMYLYSKLGSLQSKYFK